MSDLNGSGTKWILKLSLFIMFISLLIFRGEFVQAAPAVMVTDVSGSVSTSSGHVALLDQLSEGSEIRLGSDAFVVVVYLKSGKQTRVDGPGLAKVGGDDVMVSGGARQQSKQIHYKGIEGNALAINPVQTQVAGVIMRGEHTRPRVELDNLRSAYAAQAHPTFRWHTTAPAERFHFRLEDEKGKVIHSEVVQTRSLQLPEAIQLNPDQRYTWYLKATFSGKSSDSDWGDFVLLSEQARDEVAKRKPAKDASFSDQLLYAVWLEQHELFDAAVKQWEFLSSQRPEDQRLKALRQP